MTTEQGNKMIAEFMGQDYKNYKTATIGILTPEKAEYHTSWDWLMPVVEKIEKDFATDFQITIYSASCFIDKWDKKKQIYDSFVSGVGKKIEAVYDAIVQFIQWYNANKSTI